MQHAVSRFTAIGPATIAGVLHNLGAYPGATLPTSDHQKIQGTLFAFPDDSALLAELDAYEGFDPTSRSTSLFVREQCEATLPDGSCKSCWVYLYNGTP